MKAPLLMAVLLLVGMVLAVPSSVFASAADCHPAADQSQCTPSQNVFCGGAGGSCCATQADCDALIQAYSPWYNQDVTTYTNNVFTPPESEVNSTRFAKAQFENIALSIGVGAIGAPNLAQAKNDSAIAQLGRAIGFMAGNPPAGTAEYIAYMGAKSGFISQAYAQGAGFRALSPVIGVWTAFRNIAYLFTAIVLIVLGFLIMLRKKIDAQTVIGVQQALPRIVVTLLLITFSYAIAGFVIDMMYFSIYFLIKILATFGVLENSGDAALRTITQHSIFQIGFWDFFGWGGSGVVGTVASAADRFVGDIIGGGGFGAAIGLISKPIAYLVIAVMLLYAVFKLFFQLLMAYIQIIVGTVIGPLQLMLNAMPGSESFSKWLRNLVANAAAFPATVAMFLLGVVMIGPKSGAAWEVNPNIGYSAPSTLDSLGGSAVVAPLINIGNIDAIQALIGLGIILMTPKVVEMVKEALQAPENKYGSAIGEALGFGWKGTKASIGYPFGVGERALGIRKEEEAARREFEAQEKWREAISPTGKYTARGFMPGLSKIDKFKKAILGK